MVCRHLETIAGRYLSLYDGTISDKLTTAVNRVIVADNVEDSDQTSELLCGDASGAVRWSPLIHTRSGGRRGRFFSVGLRIGKHKSALRV